MRIAGEERRDRLQERRRSPVALLDAVVADVRHGARVLARYRSTTALLVLCLGLGVGANSALYGIVHALLRPPSGIADPEGLVRIEAGAGPQGLSRGSGAAWSYTQFQALRQALPFVQNMAAYAPIQGSIGVGEAARPANIVVASPGYFSVLGVRAQMGAVSGNDDAGPAAVISDRLWRSRFGASRAAVGSTLVVNGTPVVVAGVAPADFAGLDVNAPDVWLPLSMATLPAFGGPNWLSNRVFWLRLAGRLRPGVSRAQAKAWLAGPGRRAGSPQLRSLPPVSIRALATGFGTDQAGRNPVPAWVLAITISVILLASCTAANLLLGQGVSRRGEIAVRLAMGASRGRVVGQLLTESILLAALAAACAALFASGGQWLAPHLGLPAIRNLLDGRVLVFTIVVALATILVFALLPALWLARRDPVQAIKGAAPQAAGPRWGVQRALMTAQVAISFGLIVCAGLFVHSLRNVTAVDAGFDYEHLVVVAPDLFARGYTAQEATQFFEEARARLARLPGVENTAVDQQVPFFLFRTTFVELPGVQREIDQPGSVRTNMVGPGFFRTARIRLVTGRPFTAEDRTGGTPVAVVSQALAASTWPDESAIGKCLKLASSACVTVVGVVADARLDGIEAPPRPQLYLPIAQAPASLPHARLLVRVSGAGARVIPAIRQELQALDPALPFIHAEPLMQRLRPHLLPWRVGAVLFGVFGLLAFVLAGIGLYTVVAFLVAQRTREIGIRTALGAARSDIGRLVLTANLVTCAEGIGVGAILSFAASRLLASRLVGVATVDPWSYGAAAALLVTAAVVASIAPAARAARVDPLEALRAE